MDSSIASDPWIPPEGCQAFITVKSRYLLLVVGLTVAHAVGAALAPVSGDEAYYWDCSRHLDWSYFDQPPLTIWLMIPFRFLFGETALAVRSPAILAGLLAGFFLLPLVRRLGGTTSDAALVYLLLHAQPIFALGFSYTSTDVVMGTAYLGAIWAAVAVAQGHRRAWWGLGVALGLGFLAKFSIIVAFLPAAVALLSPKARADLKTVTPWAAALVSDVLDNASLDLGCSAQLGQHRLPAQRPTLARGNRPQVSSSSSSVPTFFWRHLSSPFCWWEAAGQHGNARTRPGEWRSQEPQRPFSSSDSWLFGRGSVRTGAALAS